MRAIVLSSVLVPMNHISFKHTKLVQQDHERVDLKEYNAYCSNAEKETHACVKIVIQSTKQTHEIVRV